MRRGRNWSGSSIRRSWACRPKQLRRLPSAPIASPGLWRRGDWCTGVRESGNPLNSRATFPRCSPCRRFWPRRRTESGRSPPTVGNGNPPVHRMSICWQPAPAVRSALSQAAAPIAAFGPAPVAGNASAISIRWRERSKASAVSVPPSPSQLPSEAYSRSSSASRGSVRCRRPAAAPATDFSQIATLGTEHAIILSSRGPALTDAAGQSLIYALGGSLPIELALVRVGRGQNCLVRFRAGSDALARRPLQLLRRTTLATG